MKARSSFAFASARAQRSTGASALRRRSDLLPAEHVQSRPRSSRRETTRATWRWATSAPDGIDRCRRSPTATAAHLEAVPRARSPILLGNTAPRESATAHLRLTATNLPRGDRPVAIAACGLRPRRHPRSRRRRLGAATTSRSSRDTAPPLHGDGTFSATTRFRRKPSARNHDRRSRRGRQPGRAPSPTTSDQCHRRAAPGPDRGACPRSDLAHSDRRNLDQHHRWATVDQDRDPRSRRDRRCSAHRPRRCCWEPGSRPVAGGGGFLPAVNCAAGGQPFDVAVEGTGTRTVSSISRGLEWIRRGRGDPSGLGDGTIRASACTFFGAGISGAANPLPPATDQDGITRSRGVLRRIASALAAVRPGHGRCRGQRLRCRGQSGVPGFPAARRSRGDFNADGRPDLVIA